MPGSSAASAACALLPELVQSNSAVDVEQARAEQRRELAGPGAAQQVHLEQAVLGMGVSGCARNVDSRLAADHRHARRVALDRDPCVEAGERRLAVDRRQARTEREPGGGDCEQQERDGDADGPEENPLPEGTLTFVGVIQAESWR